jgi:hypothetical protein
VHQCAGLVYPHIEERPRGTLAEVKCFSKDIASPTWAAQNVNGERMHNTARHFEYTLPARAGCLIIETVSMRDAACVYPGYDELGRGKTGEGVGHVMYAGASRIGRGHIPAERRCEFHLSPSSPSSRGESDMAAYEEQLPTVRCG